MIQNIAYSLILGKPLIMYMGILTILFVIFTATVGILNYKGIKIIPFKWHLRLAVITIAFALIHAIFGLSIFLDF